MGPAESSVIYCEPALRRWFAVDFLLMVAGWVENIYQQSHRGTDYHQLGTGMKACVQCAAWRLGKDALQTAGVPAALNHSTLTLLRHITSRILRRQEAGDVSNGIQVQVIESSQTRSPDARECVRMHCHTM